MQRSNTSAHWPALMSLRVVPANRRQVIEVDITAKIAPTRLSGIILVGAFRFPVERYAADLMPSLSRAINVAVS